MFILLSGVPPFNGHSDHEITKAVKKGMYEYNEKRWGRISKHSKDLIDKMLVKDPSKRITAQDALDHKWFKNYLGGTLKREKLDNAMQGLQSFKINQKMQHAAMSYIVTHLATKEDTKDLDEAFRKLDVNHDGRLSLDELLSGCRKVFPNMSEDEAREIFEKADADGNGELDYTEWITATIDKKRILSMENLKAAFKMFDIDGDGRISTAELKTILGKGKDIDEEVWEQIVKEIDENDDGEIDFEEFEHMMNKFLEEENS